jgi:hypothetical protein
MKKEYIILSSIIVLLSAYLVFHKVGSTHYTLPVLNDISNQDITKIELSKAGKNITIEKQGDSWVVGVDKFPANDAIVNSMIKIIKNLKFTTLIAESGNYNRYDLDDQNKIKVTAWNNGNMSRSFDVGKVASTFRHTFVKLENDPRIFHAEENFRDTFDKTEDGIEEKTILKFDQAMIKGIHAMGDNKTIALEEKKEPVNTDTKKDDKTSAIKADNKPATPETRDVWADVTGKEIEKTKITDFVSIFNNLQCDTYIKGAKKEDFKTPLYQIVLVGKKTYTLSIFNKTDEKGGYPAVSSENNFPFTLSATTVDDIKTMLNGI